MPNDYSEDQMIQKSTAELMEKELGWKSVYAFDSEVMGENGTLGRTSCHEVLLVRHFKAAIIVTIRDMLWQQLPESYSEESINICRNKVYEYVSSHYNYAN